MKIAPALADRIESLIRTIREQKVIIDAAAMTMPEAAINKNDSLIFCRHNVGTARQLNEDDPLFSCGGLQSSCLRDMLS